MEERDPDSPTARYRQACERLARLLGGDPEVREAVGLLADILRFESTHDVPQADSFLARTAAGRPRGGRTALISDIHGNIDGLRVVLADIDRQACDRIVCLGDSVEGGPGNDEVVELLRARAVRAVRGNHDEHNDVALSEATRAWLAALPESIAEGDVLFTHISPRARKRKINHAVEAWNAFEEAAFRLLFIGHVHVPLLFAATTASYGESSRVAFEYNHPFALDPRERYIACVGSVGYGRDLVGKLRYAILDSGAGTLEFRAIDGPLLPQDDSLRGPLGAQGAA